LNKSVSIVIRCLNENDNLKVLIPILLNQNYKDFELIFVDSGSTDGTLETINKYILKSNNFFLYHIKKLISHSEGHLISDFRIQTGI
jgi:glycosyltransferase involved in cell wall biosynthesis